MDKKRYLKRSIAIVCVATIIAIAILVVLQNAIYKSLESNLENKLIESDKQRVFALEKQFAVFSTSMDGIAKSIRQMDKDGLRKSEIRLRILLSDLCSELGATIMGICDDEGNGVVGVDVELDKHPGIKQVVDTGEGVISFAEKGTQGERESLMFATPVQDKNGEKYVLYATIARSLMSNVFNASTTYENQNIMVVQKSDDAKESATGVVILPMDNKETQNKIMEELEKLMGANKGEKNLYTKFSKDLAKKGYAIERMDIENYSKQYVAIVKLANMPWYLLTAVPTSETDVYIDEATDKVTILFGIMLVMFISVIALIMYLQYKNQARVFNLAYYDSKTGLYNWEYMQGKIDEKEKVCEKLAIIVFDVRGLKYINELYGYHEGDKVIIGMADYLRKNKFSEDVYSMYGKLNNDAFALIVEYEVNDILKNYVKKYIAGMRKAVSENFDVMIGSGMAALEKNSHGNYHTSLDNAYTAMNLVRNSREFMIGVYDSKLKEEELLNKKIEGDLSEAIKDRDLLVYYQPKYDAKTEKLVGAEALVRWQHKELGFLPPGKFIPIFENNGLIGKIDMYVLEEVCRYMKSLKNAGLKIPVISVNLSRAEINDRNLVKNIKKLRKKYEIESNLIEIEITESSMNNNENKLIEISESLHKAGFGLAIDDFGTGYSSFAQLIKMPLDTIKLDKSFIDSYSLEGRGSNVHVFICDVIQIAKHIDCKVVAEGVETKDQRDMLAEANCDIIQGYYYGKPMPSKEFREVIEAN